ncbi:sre1 Sterol regulatory element-binding protein 1 [Candida maltosa Xu316]
MTQSNLTNDLNDDASHHQQQQQQRFPDHQTPIPTFASQHQQQQQQQQHQAQQDTQSQHNSNHNTNNSSQQGLNSMGTPLASPLSIDTNNFQRQQLSEKPSSVLDYQNSKSLTEQASKISFGGNTQQSSISNTNIDSPPVSPLNTHNTSKLKSSSTSTSTSISSTTIPPTTKKTKGRKIKVENPTGTSINNSGDNINTINHNPHPGRPRIKSAHNVIEQRYRNKINDKFNALQNSVPTLRILAKKKEREKMMLQQHHQDNSNEDYDSSEDEMMDSKSSSTSNTNLNGNTSLLMGNGNGVNKFDDIDLEGLEPARKLNKGTILAKSIEYIKFLELKNDRMKQEHDELVLKARMLGLVIEDDQL